MNRLIIALSMLLTATAVSAAGGGHVLYTFEPDAKNTSSVQRGAKYFMNYCSGCHSMEYLRFNRLAQDHAIPDDLLSKLMFTTDKPGEHILSAMPQEKAAEWFGQAPPDLTLTARLRGADWVYSFLKSYYLDDSKATGTNNLQLPGASMPHVLGGLQGYQVLGEEEHHDDAGGHHGPVEPPFELVVDGELSAKEYDGVVADLVNFMSYAAEPGKAKMHDRGFWALLYVIFILIPLTYAIKREFWKDVH